MSGFDIKTPASLAEAIDILNTEDSTVRAFSGGTALMLMIKTGILQPSVLVNLRHIEPRHREITATADGGLRIGGLASLREIELSPDVGRIAPSIPAAMERLSNIRVRNAARIGGNLAHADPHMDMPPVLASLGGSVKLEGPRGQRRVLIEDLFTGYYETVLGRGELITEVLLPAQQGWYSVYKKVTTRSAYDWPALGLAVSLKHYQGAAEDIRIMVSAAARKLTRLSRTEAELRSKEITGAVLARAIEAAMAEVETVGDARGTSAYKRELVGVFLRRAVSEAAGGKAAWTH
jgi:carbon-monoxide dehydrogenase medium subunit